MTKNPILNALSATGYITLVVTVMNYISKTFGSKPDPAFAPVVFLSVLCLSVAIMGYIFFYQPVVLLIDGKKKEAVRFFVQTIVFFAAITVIVSVFLFSGLIK